MTRPPPDDPPAGVCDRCGRDGARRLGDRWLCEECYFAGNSCCLEFGGDDRWAEMEKAPPPGR